MAKASLRQAAQSDFDALFGARKGERSVSGGFKMLSHSRIRVRPQVRRTFHQEELDELQASIRALRDSNEGIEGTGVLQALLVCPEGDGYRLIAGEKRFRATQAVGLAEIPCIVIAPPAGDHPEAAIRLLQLTENAQRTAPPVLEEARAIRETMDDQGLSLRDVARLLGKTLGYVTNRVSLLKMSADVQGMVEARSNTLRVATHIDKVSNPTQRADLIRAVIEEEISEREVLRRISGETASNGEVFSRENTKNTPGDHKQPKVKGSVLAREHPEAVEENAPASTLEALKVAEARLVDASNLWASGRVRGKERDKVRLQIETLDGILKKLKTSVG